MLSTLKMTRKDYEKNILLAMLFVLLASQISTAKSLTVHSTAVHWSNSAGE